MRRILTIVLVTVALGAAVPGRATTVVAAGGSARFGSGSSCLIMGAVASPDLNRQRATANYHVSGATANPAGLCEETDPHMHLTFLCIDGARTESGAEMFASARGDDGNLYLVRIQDADTDRIGVTRAAPAAGAPRCGAADVVTEPILAGGFAITAA